MIIEGSGGCPVSDAVVLCTWVNDEHIWIAGLRV